MNGAAPLLSELLLLLFLLPLLLPLLLLEQTTGSRYHVGEVTPGYTSAYMNVYYCSTCDAVRSFLYFVLTSAIAVHYLA